MPCSPSKRSTRMVRGMNPTMSGHHPPVKHRRPPARLCPLCPADPPGPIYGFQSCRSSRHNLWTSSQHPTPKPNQLLFLDTHAHSRSTPLMARPDAAKYDPAMAFFILVTEFHSRIYGLLAFKVASEKQIETIGKMRWFNEALERGENKDRMKQLGGFLSFSRTLLREFSILGMAKAFENVIVT